MENELQVGVGEAQLVHPGSWNGAGQKQGRHEPHTGVDLNSSWLAWCHWLRPVSFLDARCVLGQPYPSCLLAAIPIPGCSGSQPEQMPFPAPTHSRLGMNQ